MGCCGGVTPNDLLINGGRFDEGTPLLNGEKISIGEGKLAKALYIIKLIEAPLSGMAKTYSAVRLFTIVFFQPSLYILIPLAAGAAISFFADLFPPRMEDEKKTCEPRTTLGKVNELGVELLEDFGFFWEALEWTVATFSTEENPLPKYALPLLSVAPALFSRGIRYRHHHQHHKSLHEDKNTYHEQEAHSCLDMRGFKIAAEGIRGAASSAYFTGLLHRQGRIPEHSSVPLILIGVTALLSAVSELIRPWAPRLADGGMIIIDFIEKLSLSTAFLDIPFSIYAAIEILLKKEPIIPNAFEWPMFTLTAIYGLVIMIPILIRLLKVLASVPFIQKHIPFIPYLAKTQLALVIDGLYSQEEGKDEEVKKDEEKGKALNGAREVQLEETPPPSPRDNVVDTPEVPAVPDTKESRDSLVEQVGSTTSAVVDGAV